MHGRDEARDLGILGCVNRHADRTIEGRRGRRATITNRREGLGAATRHRRPTRSGGLLAVASGSVVRGVRRAPLTPRQPLARMIRSTVHRATGMPILPASS